jgi:hypothetical protein
MFYFIEKVHILRITHFSETTKDRNLIFGMGGDANVKLCIQLFVDFFSVFKLNYCYGIALLKHYGNPKNRF